MKRAVDKTVAAVFHASGQDAYLKAADMIKDKQAYNCFDNIKFAKSLNIYGKAIYEGVNYSYTTDIPSKVERQENSIKTDLGLNYKSKSENTKAMLFSSLTKTNTKTSFDSPKSPEGEIPEKAVDANYKSYSIYGVL